jgi:choline-sulfatase
MTPMRALLPLALLSLSLGLLSCSREEDPAGRPPDVILVSIDTWRFDHASWVDPNLAHTTPRLAAWAARADYAGTALAPVPLTLPSHTTMMTGLYPDEHGVRENDGYALPPAAERPFSVLAEDLHAAGYRTGAFVAAQPLDRRFGLGAGFDHYRQPEGGVAPRSHTFRELPGKEVTERALSWVRETVRAEDPLFLFVHYFDPHWPYEPPETGPADRDERYATEVRRADAAVGDLLAGLGERAENALVLIVGDHGEALGAHGRAPTATWSTTPPCACPA